MATGSVVWSETPDDENDEAPEAETHGDVDDTLAVRRLRRWIRGMFGGTAEPPPEEREPEK